MTKHNDLVVSAIDVERESILTFSQAARYVGKLKGQKRIALQTLFRWCTKGRSGVLLERIYIGGTPCTSKEALQRFFDRRTVVATGSAASTIESRDALGGDAPVGDIDALLRRAGVIDSEVEGQL